MHLAKRYLILARHADAVPAGPGEKDRSHVLTDLGVRQAEAAGNFIRQEKMNVDEFWCSPAARATQTLTAMTGLAVSNPSVHLTEDLYSGSPDDYLRALWHGLENTQAMMLIGHNPTVSLFASRITGATISLSTGAVVVVAFPLASDTTQLSLPGKIVGQFIPSANKI